MQKTGIYSEIPDDSPDITFSSSQITMIKRLDGIIRQILLRVVAAIPLFKATPHNKAKRTVLLARSFWQNGLRLEFSQKAYGFKPPGRACQPEADSPMRT